MQRKSRRIGGTSAAPRPPARARATSVAFCITPCAAATPVGLRFADARFLPIIRGNSTREIAKPIIRWEETTDNATGKPIPGYEILPNKYFYRYQPPTPAKDLRAEFWRLEKEAEKMLEGLAK